MRSTTPSSCACAVPRRDIFGLPSQPYPEFYTPKPYSKSFVLHLDAWYAQSHPDEDFAETFAVWLTPNSEWRAALRGMAGAQEARIHGRADALAARTGAARRQSGGNRSAARRHEDAAAALPQQAPPLRRRLPELLRPRSAAPLLRCAGVRDEHHRRAVHRPHPPSGAPRGRRLDRASTSTRSIRCSRT